MTKALRTNSSIPSGAPYRRPSASNRVVKYATLWVTVCSDQMSFVGGQSASSGIIFFMLSSDAAIPPMPPDCAKPHAPSSRFS